MSEENLLISFDDMPIEQVASDVLSIDADTSGVNLFEGLLDESLRNKKKKQLTQFERHSFKLAKFNFVVPLDSASMVLDVPPISKLPKTPDWFLGIANIKSRIINVVDLVAYFGFEEQKGKKMLLIFGKNEHEVGVIIDDVTRKLRFDSSHRMNSPKVSDKIDFAITGAFKSNEDIWFDFDSDLFFKTLEESF